MTDLSALLTVCSNKTKHLRTAHPLKYEAYKKKKEEEEQRIKDEAAKSLRLAIAASKPKTQQTLQVAKGPKSVLPYRVMINYTQNDIKKFYSASLAIHLRPPEMSRTDTMSKVVFWMASGGTFQPPSINTIKSHHIEFEKQLNDNIQAFLIKHGVLTKDGNPRRHPIPIISLSFDLTTTETNGIHTISLRISLLDEDFNLKHVSLGVKRFKLSDEDLTEEEVNFGITKASAANLAKFALIELKRRNIVPKEVEDTTVIGEYVMSGSTDNAQAEINASSIEMGLYSQSCVLHTLDLAVKESIRDIPELLHLLDTLAEGARACKKGRGADALRDSQIEAGVENPTRLASRSNTRWGMSVRQLNTAIKTRDHANPDHA